MVVVVPRERGVGAQPTTLITLQSLKDAQPNQVHTCALHFSARC